MMLIALTGILTLNIFLYLLSNLFYQNRILRIVRNAGFIISLLFGTASGVVAYLTQSTTYYSEFCCDWFIYANIGFRLSLIMNSVIAYLIGFYSFMHLIVLFITPEVIKTRERFNSLCGAYLLITGLMLSNDLMTFFFFWCWLIILLMLLIRKEIPSFNYPPILGIFSLLIICLLIINISHQISIPDENVLRQYPANSVIVIGSLLTIIVLIQGCQFPLPVWLPTGSATKPDLPIMFIYISSVFLILGVLLWKFYQIFLPIHRIILSISGFLTILVAFIRIHTGESDLKTKLIYFLTGSLGLALISLLSDNSSFLIQLLAGFQVTMSILIIGQLHLKPVSSKRIGQILTDSFDFVTLALITGIPTSIHYVLRLTFLKDLLAAQTSPFIQYFAIILSTLAVLAIIGMAVRIITQIRQNRPQGAFIVDQVSSNRRSVIALMLTWGTGLWFFYPIKPPSGLAPIGRSILLFSSNYHLNLSEHIASLNLILTGFWVISLVGFLLFGNRITLPPLVKWSRSDIYDFCFGQVPHRLAQLVHGADFSWRRWLARLGQLFLPKSLISSTIKKTIAALQAQSSNLGKGIGNRLSRQRWLFLIIGIGLLVVGFVLLFLYFTP
jgi:hypothetical protein